MYMTSSLGLMWNSLRYSRPRAMNTSDSSSCHSTLTRLPDWESARAVSGRLTIGILDMGRTPVSADRGADRLSEVNNPLGLGETPGLVRLVGIAVGHVGIRAQLAKAEACEDLLGSFDQPVSNALAPELRFYPDA